MDYTIELSESRKFFRVRTASPVTLDLARQWAIELEEKSRALGIRRFLFDVRSTRNVCTVLENYRFAYKDSAELELQRNVRSAILVSKEDRSHDFVELSMNNAGYNVQLFTEESAAVQWLEENGA